MYPDLIGRLYREYLAGDRETLMKTQEQVIMVRQITKYGLTVPTCHAILKLRGIDAGYPRLPFQLVSPEIEERVKASLKSMNLL